MSCARSPSLLGAPRRSPFPGVTQAVGEAAAEGLVPAFPGPTPATSGSSGRCRPGGSAAGPPERRSGGGSPGPRWGRPPGRRRRRVPRPRASCWGCKRCSQSPPPKPPGMRAAAFPGLLLIGAAFPSLALRVGPVPQAPEVPPRVRGALTPTCCPPSHLTPSAAALPGQKGAVRERRGGRASGASEAFCPNQPNPSFPTTSRPSAAPDRKSVV